MYRIDGTFPPPGAEPHRRQRMRSEETPCSIHSPLPSSVIKWESRGVPCSESVMHRVPSLALRTNLLHPTYEHMLLSSVCIVLQPLYKLLVRRRLLVVVHGDNEGRRVFAIDSCGGDARYGLEPSHVKVLPFRQDAPPTHSRFVISQLERQQMQAAARDLPSDCRFVVKLTGRYTPTGIWDALGALKNGTVLALSSRGSSYGGYASELFGMDRHLLSHSLWTDKRNTESFVQRVYAMVRSVSPDAVAHLPRLALSRPTRRYSDKRVLTYV